MLSDPPTEDLEDLYENAPCGYLSMQPDERIFKANTTLATWTGIKSAELVGKRLPDLLSFGTRIFYETTVAPQLRLQGSFDEVSLELLTASGERLPVFANAVERRGADEQHLFTRLTIFKAAERRRYERQIIEAREAADAANLRAQGLEAIAQDLLTSEREASDLREQFIAVLGHDLRNPLAAIDAGAKMLQRVKRDDKETQIVGLMRSSVVRMSGLIDNVLDFARGRLGGGLSITRTADQPLQPILEQVIAELTAAWPDRAIVSDVALTEPVSCDRGRIGQLLSNLLGNALTYGAIDKPVQVHAETEQASFVMWVANGGEPIQPATLERLFEPFARGAVKSTQQGLGLGLYIAAEVARAHCGKLGVTSTAQETRFTLRMPLR